MNQDARPEHPADRLLAAIEKKGSPVCVGLDPVAAKMPRQVGDISALGRGDMRPLIAFCCNVIEAVSPHVPCVKVQSACFERYGVTGCGALSEVLAFAKNSGVEVILDAKRGDIGVSAEHYAAAAFRPGKTAAAPDWITINAYLGEDGIEPFLRYPGHGAFALVRTSNPGGDAIQNLQLSDGRTVAEAVAQLIAKIGSSDVGPRGYSSLGAVVGATKPDDARRLRGLMPQQVFLVPGYGAQGGSIDDVLPCFNTDGAGAIITASRSVIYAFEPGDSNWQRAVERAAAGLAREVSAAVA